MNWPASSKSRHLLTKQHAEHRSFNHGTRGTHGNSWVLTSVYSVWSVVPWFHGSTNRSGQAVGESCRTAAEAISEGQTRTGVSILGSAGQTPQADPVSRLGASRGHGQYPAEVVQPVRRTSSPSAKAYRWINRRNGLEVRRTRRSKRKFAAKPHATAFLRVQTSDSNKDSIVIKIPEAGQRREAGGNSREQARGEREQPNSGKTLVRSSAGI